MYMVTILIHVLYITPNVYGVPTSLNYDKSRLIKINKVIILEIVSMNSNTSKHLLYPLTMNNIYQTSSY